MQTPFEIEEAKTTKLDIPALTFLKIFVAIIVAMSLAKLYPLILLVFLSAMLAFALAPLVGWLTAKGLPRGVALGGVVFTLIASACAFVFLLIPRLFAQLGVLVQNIGPLQQAVMSHLPEGPMRGYIGRSIQHPETVFGNLPDYLATVGSMAFNSLWSVGIFLIVAIYFLIDGGRAYKWILGFFTPLTQRKLNQTTNELEKIVSAYIGGQFITCAIVAVYVFVTCHLLHVPGALMLAVIAAIFDILPIIGFITSTFCAVVMALTVSPETALIVVALHFAYQLVENYLIVPKVYGKKMKLSTLVVLLSFLVAGTLAGISGAILVLPVVAAYPVVERIWLRRYLGDEVVETHKEQLAEPDQSEKLEKRIEKKIQERLKPNEST